MPIIAIIVAHLLLLPQARSCFLPGYHLFLCLEPSAQSCAPGFLKISCTVASRIEQSLLTHADSNVINVKVLLAGEGCVLSYCYPALDHGLLYIVKPTAFWLPKNIQSFRIWAIKLSWPVWSKSQKLRLVFWPKIYLSPSNYLPLNCSGLFVKRVATFIPQLGFWPPN